MACIASKDLRHFIALSFLWLCLVCFGDVGDGKHLDKGHLVKMVVEESCIRSFIVCVQLQTYYE